MVLSSQKNTDLKSHVSGISTFYFVLQIFGVLRIATAQHASTCIWLDIINLNPIKELFALPQIALEYYV